MSLRASSLSALLKSSRAFQSGWQYEQSDFTEYDALKLLTGVDLFIDDLGTESVMNDRKRWG